MLQSHSVFSVLWAKGSSGVIVKSVIGVLTFFVTELTKGEKKRGGGGGTGITKHTNGLQNRVQELKANIKVAFFLSSFLIVLRTGHCVRSSWRAAHSSAPPREELFFVRRVETESQAN